MSLSNVFSFRAARRRIERQNWGMYWRMRREHRRQRESSLFEHIIDHENLIATFKRLRRFGGQAAGPDGIRPGDLSMRDAAAIMRRVSGFLRDGSYLPGPTRTQRLPKGNGEYRELQIPNLVTGSSPPQFRKRSLGGWIACSSTGRMPIGRGAAT